MNKNTFMALVAICLIGLVGFLVYSRSTQRGDQEAVQIAVNIPLTGPIAAFSGQYANGLQMGIDDACTEFGINRSIFKVDVQDNAGKPATAVSIMEKQNLRGFDAYISGTSDMSNAIAKVLDESPAPHLLVSFDAFMTSQGKNRLRILPHYKIEGPKYVEYAVKRGAKRVFSVTLNNSAIQEEFDRFVEPELAKNGIEFKREVIDWGFSDYRTIAQKAKDFSPDLIFINGFSVHILPTIQSLRAFDLVEPGNVLCVMDFIDLLYENVDRKELVDVAFIAPQFELNTDNKARNEWQEKYKKRFGVTPNYVPAFAYDTGYLFVLAYKNARSLTKEKLIEQLPFDGIASRITVDSEGDFDAGLGIAIVDSDGAVTANIPEPASANAN